MIASNDLLDAPEIDDDAFLATLGRKRAGPAIATLGANPKHVLEQPPTVFVVDPDPATGMMVKDLLHGHGMKVEEFASGREFFAAYSANGPGCLVLEQRIFDMSGLQIQRRLAKQRQRLPMVYVVTPGLEVSTAVGLMREGQSMSW